MVKMLRWRSLFALLCWEVATRREEGGLFVCEDGRRELMVRGQNLVDLFENIHSCRTIPEKMMSRKDKAGLLSEGHEAKDGG